MTKFKYKLIKIESITVTSTYHSLVIVLCKVKYEENAAEIKSKI